MCRRVFAGKTQWRVAGTLGEQVTDRLVGQPISWHQRRPDGDLVARAGVDVDAAVAVLAPIPFSVGTVLLVVVSAAWLLVSDVVIGLVAVAVFPILIAVNVLYQRRVDIHYTDAQDHLGTLSAAVHESFDGVQLVKAYGAEQRETERLSTIAGSLRDARVRAVRLRGTFEALLDVLPSLTNVALVVVGAMRDRRRRDHRRPAVQLRVPLHAARLPAAVDRVRALGDPALVGRLAACAHRPRRADRARSARPGDRDRGRRRRPARRRRSSRSPATAARPSFTST